VPATADGDDEVVLTRVAQRRLDVLGTGAAGDERRVLVDQAVEEAAGRVVARVLRSDELTGERLGSVAEVGIQALQTMVCGGASRTVESSADCNNRLVSRHRGGQRLWIVRVRTVSRCVVVRT
jgi:hypothetical protein